MAQVLTLQWLHSNRRGHIRDPRHPDRLSECESLTSDRIRESLLLAAGLLLLAFCSFPGGLAGQDRASLTVTALVLRTEPSRDALARLPGPTAPTAAVSQTPLALIRVEAAPADSLPQTRRRVTITFVRN